MAEIIGVLATLFLVASFACNGEKKIRFVNSIGAILFVVYGLMINAWSTAVSNLIILFLNIFKMSKGE